MLRFLSSKRCRVLVEEWCVGGYAQNAVVDVTVSMDGEGVNRVV
jgi:uncharacterized protein YabE (DUF348 family)